MKLKRLKRKVSIGKITKKTQTAQGYRTRKMHNFHSPDRKENGVVPKTMREKWKETEHDGEKVPERQKSFKNLFNYLSWMQLNLRTPANRKKNFQFSIMMGDGRCGYMCAASGKPGYSTKTKSRKQNYKKEAKRRKSKVARWRIRKKSVHRLQS